MIDPYGERVPVLYLKPMEAYLIKSRMVVVTVLGSCLTVTMFHRQSGLSAICHALLPRCDRNGPCPAACAERLKYVDCTIREMAQRLQQSGARRGEIKVKVFGGADMFSVREGREEHTVGKQNFRAAVEVLAKEGLIVAASDVGGSKGRKIYYFSFDGKVLLKRLENTEGMNIFSVEKIGQALKKPASAVFTGRGAAAAKQDEPHE